VSSMMHRFFAAIVVATLLCSLPANSPRPLQTKRSTDPIEDRIPVGIASLYTRVIGRGQPVIILHGGPDFTDISCPTWID
jgi:hypothetical protein